MNLMKTPKFSIFVLAFVASFPWDFSARAASPSFMTCSFLTQDRVHKTDKAESLWKALGSPEIERGSNQPLTQLNYKVPHRDIRVTAAYRYDTNELSASIHDVKKKTWVSSRAGIRNSSSALAAYNVGEPANPGFHSGDFVGPELHVDVECRLTDTQPTGETQLD